MKAVERIYRLLASFPSYLWELIYRFRRALYSIGFFKSQNYNIPVISVGNLAMGGTGKTPVTLWLNNYFVNKGLNPLILMRAYKSEREKSSGLISPENLIAYDPKEYGDEPLMLAQNMKGGKILIGQNRLENLERYYRLIKPDLIILEDGYQHLKLQRDLNLLLIDSLMPESQYHAPPLGFLREGMSASIDADAVIFTRADLLPTEKRMSLVNFFKPYLKDDASMHFIGYEPKGLKASEGLDLEIDSLRGKKVVLLSAIASPQGFYSVITNTGAIICKDYQFPDHHSYTQKDLDDIMTFADKSSAKVICTEKDYVKIKQLNISKFIDKVYYLKIDISFLDEEKILEKKLDALLKKYEL